MKNPKQGKPCGFIYENDGKEIADSYPAISCSYVCERCGWNPKEQKRRLEEGRFEKRVKTLELHDDSGNTVIATITDELNTLVFPRRELNA